VFRGFGTLPGTPTASQLTLAKQLVSVLQVFPVFRARRGGQEKETFRVNLKGKSTQNSRQVCLPGRFTLTAEEKRGWNTGTLEHWKK
jgi:hypothetical protein